MITISRLEFITSLGERIQKDFMHKAFSTLKWSTDELIIIQKNTHTERVIKSRAYDEFKITILEYMSLIDCIKNIKDGPSIQKFRQHKFTLREFFKDEIYGKLGAQLQNSIDSIMSEEVYVLETVYDILLTAINGTICEIFTALTDENQIGEKSISKEDLETVQKCMDSLIEKYVDYGLLYRVKDCPIAPSITFADNKETQMESITPNMVN